MPFQQTCAKIVRNYLDIRGDLDTDVLFVNINNDPISTRALQEKMQAYGRAVGIKGVRVPEAKNRCFFDVFSRG